jgi:hypothetical protein
VDKLSDVVGLSDVVVVVVDVCVEDTRPSEDVA